MKRTLLLLFGLILVFGVMTSAVTAQQRDDRDGDGIPNDQDRCPDRAGPGSNGGCPLPDRDGDGIPDDIDRCPNAGGPASNNGCPPEEETTPAATPVPTMTLPTLPTSGDCMLATQGPERVNVHADPWLDAAVVGSLDPTTLYPVSAEQNSSEGMWERLTTGWVAGWVVRLGGSCDMLPYIEQLGGPDTTGDHGLMPLFEPLSPPDTSDIMPGEGADPSADLLAGFCATGQKVAWHSSADPGGEVLVNLTFGSDFGAATWISLGRAQWCAQVNPDQQGIIVHFMPNGADPSTQGFVINWYMGFAPGGGENPTESVVIAIIQPAPGADVSWDEILANGGSDVQGLMIIWCKPPNPNAQGIIINYDIGVDPDTQGIVINWMPVGVDANAQGIIIDYMPGRVDPNAQGIVVNWFPNGVDPDAQGIIIIGGHQVTPGIGIQLHI